jgi:non-specific protein-tyrosine kinase
LTEPPALQATINRLHLNTSPDSLARQVTAVPEANSELVEVSVRDPSPDRAAQIANTLMQAYVSQVSADNAVQINQASAQLQQQINGVQATLNQYEQQLASAQKSNQDTTAIRAAITSETSLLTQLDVSLSTFRATESKALDAVSIAAPAAPPLSPASPSKTLNTAIGALAAFLLALGAAALIDFLDRGLKTPEDVQERVGVPCLGVIPRFNGSQLATQAHDKKHRSDDGVLEAYRRLRTNLLFSAADRELQTVVITSVRPGEGKTCTAANLAVALASSEKHTLLIDADLRRPDQHRIFGASLGGGLSEMIMQTRMDAVPSLNGMHKTAFGSLTLLTSGPVPPNPAELLASKRAHILLTSLSQKHDVTIIDTAPAGAVSDPLSLAADASATILVVEAGRTNASQALGVLASLQSVGANVVGIVLNKARRHRTRSYRYYYGYGAADPEREAGPADLVAAEAALHDEPAEQIPAVAGGAATRGR